MAAPTLIPHTSARVPGSSTQATASRLRVELHARSFAALDTLLHSQVRAFEPEIRDMAAYCLDTTGKRLRPLLVFASGHGNGSDQMDDLVRVAAVIEMVHLATLVHDDIMDKADARRSRPTAARKYGAAAAVLLGDTLFAQAVHLSTQFPTTEVCREVSIAARRVCSGEIMQTLGKGLANPSLDTYWRVIELKTAELFRVACRLGATVGGHGPEFAAAAEEFGRRLGVAFQIFDDLADYLGDERSIGKTLGTDFATAKLTLPLHLLRQRAPADQLDALRADVAAGRNPLDRLRDLMLDHSVDADTIAAIEAQLHAGDAALAPFSHLQAVELLLGLSAHLRGLVEGLRR